MLFNQKETIFREHNGLKSKSQQPKIESKKEEISHKLSQKFCNLPSSLVPL